MKTIGILSALVATVVAVSVAGTSLGGQSTGVSPKRPDKVVKSDAEWKKILSPEAYDVLRHEGTERAFTGKYWNNHTAGTYSCAGCDLPLFSSDDKFDSGTGWPSYVKPIKKDAVWSKSDFSYGMKRTEVRCARCDGHLGHVFEDGPSDRGGLRYCINSVCLKFKARK